MKIPTPTVSVLLSALLLTGCASVDNNTATQGWYKTWEKKAYTAYKIKPPSNDARYLAKVRVPRTRVPPENTLHHGDTPSWAGRQKSVAVEKVQVNALEQDYINRYYGI